MIKKSLSQTTISWRPSVKVSKTCIWFSIPLVKTYSLPKKFILSTLLLNQLLDTILCCHYFQYLAVNEWRGVLLEGAEHWWIITLSTHPTSQSCYLSFCFLFVSYPAYIPSFHVASMCFCLATMVILRLIGPAIY